MSRLKNVYLDSNIFIYVSLYSGEVAEKSRSYLDKASDGEFEAFTSPLVWDEVVYAARKIAGFDEAIRIGKIILRMPFLKFAPVDFDLIEGAQKLVEKYRIMPRDAIHATLALKYCDGRIISNDKDFDVIDKLDRSF